MNVDGGCHCGQVRFEAEVIPEHVVICHCTDCQTLSGSAFRTVVPTRPGTFRLLGGTLTTYIKTSDSGKRREQTFCPVCGTPIFSAPPGPEPKAVGVRVGTIRQRDRLVPHDQYWFRSAQTWLRELTHISHQPTQPVFEADGRVADATPSAKDGRQ